MSKSEQKPVVLIAGPTASGKSALALRLAGERGGVIINADSMQVYRDLRILTARPSAADEMAAPHRLYGHVGGAEDFSVAHWLADAIREIETCWQRGTIPIVCGGTGLYFLALEQGLADVPQFDPKVREKWRAFSGDLHAELAARDTEMAARLRASDRQRLSRALEVIDGTGISLAEWQRRGQRNSVLSGAHIERHLVDIPRELLYQRADQRFDAMINQGALDEVAAMPTFALDRPIMKVIGLRELLDWRAGRVPRDQAIAAAKQATRHFIKRQLTWWRGRESEGWAKNRTMP